jgi:peptide deformylase
MNEIVQKENKVLRKIAREVPIEDIKSRKVATIVRRMIKALDSQDDGVAIAAPQIGEDLRIFVISKKIFEIMEEEKELKKSQKKSKRENLDEFEKNNLSTGSTSPSTMSSGPNGSQQASPEQAKEYKDMVFINPEILKISKKKMKVEEGCLSVRWLYGKVERAEKTLVKAYDENGKLFTMGGSGLLSQAFQHETDHLNGILFIDKAKDLKEMPPEKL